MCMSVTRFFPHPHAFFGHKVLTLVLLALLAPWPQASAQQQAQPQPSLNAWDDEVRSQQFFIRGMTRSFLGDDEGAIALFQNALELTPNEPALLSALAEALEATDDIESALFYANQAVSVDASNAHYFRLLARLHLRNENPDDALSAYRSLLGVSPHDIDALQELARLHAATGNLKEAITSYEQLLHEVGEIQGIRNQILQLYFRLGDTNGVESTLRTLLTTNPSDGIYLRMLAEVLNQQDRSDDATTLYEDALASDPQNVELQVALASLYREAGRTDEASALMAAVMDAEGATVPELLSRATSLLGSAPVDSPSGKAAITMLQQVIEQDATNSEAILLLGDLYFRSGAYAEAADFLEKAVQQNPKEPQLWFQAAASYLQSSNPKDAARVAEEGLLLFPGQLPLLRVSAYGLMESYQNRQAIARFDEALEVLTEETPDDREQRSSYLAAMGLLYSRIKDTPASDSTYALAIEADPNNSFALNNYAYSLSQRGSDLETALKHAKQAVDLNPESASFLDTLGWVYFQMEQYEDAQIWIQKSIDTGSASATVYEHMGDVQEKLGQPDEARRYWSQALEKNPESTSLLEKLQLP